MMLNHPALKHENGVFVDIGGEVCNTLEVCRNPQDIDAAADNGSRLDHRCHQIPQSPVAQSVDYAAAAKEFIAHFFYSYCNTLCLEPAG